MPNIISKSKRHQPPGFEILYEDRDVIVGSKEFNVLTVKAKWNREQTVHAALNRYVRKGNSRSHKCVFVVHRLDQHTSGVLIFAKSPQAQIFLKDDWKHTEKIYYAVVHGRLAEKKGTFSSYLAEDEDYVVASVKDPKKGKLAKTAYEVVREANNCSMVKIRLLTGRKNQIRVHFAEAGHPVVGDAKYGRKSSHKRLALHAQSITFTHPFSKERVTVESPLPEYMENLVANLKERKG